MLLTNEAKLSLALRSGKRDKIATVYETIYNDYVRLVSFYVAKYVSDVEVIKDLTNDVFLCFFKNAVNVNKNIKGYLCSCARNLSLDYVKKEKHLVFLETLDDVGDNNSLDSASYYLDILSELKRVLSDKEVEIIVLHAVDGYSFDEISKKIGISKTNANVIYFRALKKFRNSERGKKYEKR